MWEGRSIVNIAGPLKKALGISSTKSMNDLIGRPLRFYFIVSNILVI